ncbi:MAG: bacteriocin [Tenacibaculum sp.]|nr:bacteriocin [Tenacibaculum sp.]
MELRELSKDELTNIEGGKDFLDYMAVGIGVIAKCFRYDKSSVVLG